MKKHIMIMALALPLLGGCQTIAAETPAASTPIPYKAHGTEPFWSLFIDDSARSLIFRDVDGQETFASFDTVRPSFNGWRYVGKGMTADITFSKCSDGMSDFIYKDTVTVMVGNEEFKGCGGGTLPPAKLEGTHWTVTEINAAEIEAERQAMFAFADGRMSGGVGCNRLGSSYAFADKRVSFGPVMATKMACPDPMGKQERDFLTVLETLSSTDFPGDSTMVLNGKNGGRVVLKQSM